MYNAAGLNLFNRRKQQTRVTTFAPASINSDNTINGYVNGLYVTSMQAGSMQNMQGQAVIRKDGGFTLL